MKEKKKESKGMEKFGERLRKMRESSMLKWFPTITDLDVNIPKTTFIEVDKGEGKPKVDIAKLQQAIKKVGGVPAFIRTDQASNKHEMANSSKVSSLARDHLKRHIFRVLQFNEMAIITGLPYQVIAVREWLNLAHSFKAFHGTPVAQELRVFIQQGEEQCHHYYWVKDSIWGANREEWEELWKHTKKETLDHYQELKPQIREVANAFEGYWSVDFARTGEGKWYLIDMALGDISFHP